MFEPTAGAVDIDNTERWIVAVIGMLFILPAVDSARVPYTHPDLWLMFYIPGVLATVWFAISLRLWALQVMLVFISLPGLCRAFLFAIGPEHRKTPICLNGVIALLMFLYHRHRRYEAVG